MRYEEELVANSGTYERNVALVKTTYVHNTEVRIYKLEEFRCGMKRYDL